MMAGRLNPELAAANIVELLDDAALDDLLADIEQDTREQFIGRALGYFGWAASDDMTAWLGNVTTAVLASVEPEPAEPAAAT